uniref:Uncharacterized protein n=1 Tax=Periophthalmus magnuspinnatus TaxID=409849 RepID=A0A3B3ZT15_9GOBI
MSSILRIIGPCDCSCVFREKAILAVSLLSDRDELLAHASFSDHPIGDLVDQAEWEPFVQHISGSKKYKVWLKDMLWENCLLYCVLDDHISSVHVSTHTIIVLFDYSILSFSDFYGSFICFKCSCVCVYVLFLLRVEDHDDVMKVFFEQTKLQTLVDNPFFLTELIETQNELQHTAVCESNGVAVGFISVTMKVSVKSLLQQYDLSECEGVFPEEQSQSEKREGEVGQSEESDGEVGQSEKREGGPGHSERREKEQDQLGKTERKMGQSEKGESKSGQSEKREKERDQSGKTKGKVDPSETREAEKGQSNVAKTQQPEQTKEKTDQTVRRRREKNPEAETDQSEDREETGPTSSEQVNIFVLLIASDRDLCLVTVPTLAPEMPLLHNFTRIFPKDMCAPAHELYGLHRIALRPVQVRRAIPSDRELIQDLVRGLDHKDFLLQDLDQFYLTETDQVRAAVLKRFMSQEVEFLRAHYNIENFIYFSHHSYQEHAALLHFVLRSTVRHCCHLLFREVLRLSHKSCLYHREYPPNSPTSCINPLDFLLDRAVPVKPRPQMDYPLEELGINAPSNQITDPQAPFALLLISRKLTLEQKVVVNARITVCGASETGLSLLETLCCCPHLRFNNLTLVSTHGFHGDAEDEMRFLSTSHAFSSRDVALLPLSSVKTVCGKVVSIDRKSKHVQVCSDRKSTPVHVPSGYWLSYDILVLCSGLQYQVWPTTLLGSYAKSFFFLLVPFLLNSNKASDRGEPTVGIIPPGNLDDTSCKVSTGALIWSLCVSLEHIVVYGDNIDAFTTVHALLSLGLTGPQIHLVLAPSESGSWLLDPAVDQAVDLNLEKVQVQVYKNYVLQNIRIQENQVTSSWFSSVSLLVFPQALVTLSCRGLDPSMLRSLLDSFLVVDGRLVVDRCFHTSDPRIWAAGPITKFSRRYHSEEWCHQRLNISYYLFCIIFLRYLFIYLGLRGFVFLICIYVFHISGGTLPGGLHFLHVTKPTPTKHSTVQYDSALVTGRANLGSYFRLQLGDSEQVESLTCASFKPLPLHNLLCLYGQQQSLLGNLSTRFSLGQVPDLYSFFRQSWCLAIFHDRFSDFQQELRAMAHHSDREGAVREEKEKKEREGEEREEPVLNSTQVLDAEPRAMVGGAVVKYVSYNRNLLPMFALPGEL